MELAYANLKDNKNKQLIYASQQGLRSFYCIYAKFKIVKSEFLESIELNIKKYKGTQFKFENKIIQHIEFKDGILRIGINTTKKGNLFESKYDFKTPINIKEIESIFLTRDPNHHNNLNTYNRNQIIELVKKEDNEEFSELMSLLEIDYENEPILAAGRNCRVSFIKTLS